VDERRTLQQLDGQDWGDPETAPTGMVARCLRLRRTPLNAISAGDLRLLIGQKIGLNALIPKAIERVSRNPLVETEYYPGDLLSALLGVDGTYWSDNSVALEQLVMIAQLALPRADDKVANECRAFVAENSSTLDKPKSRRR
jgi:CDI immunity proteins